jgi:hypothetical protein
MRCLGLSPIGNQCQNTAGKDGVCRRHRGPGKSHLPVPEDLAAEQERQATDQQPKKKNKRQRIEAEQHRIEVERQVEQLIETERQRALIELTTKLSDTSYKSIVEARRNGFVEWKRWLYGGERVDIKGHTLVRGSLEAQSATAWKRVGKVVLPDVVPHAKRSFLSRGAKQVTFPVYREDQVVTVAEWRAIQGRIGAFSA